MTLSLVRPNPWDNAPFQSSGSLSAQRLSTAIYFRYRALGNAMRDRYTRLLVEASNVEGVGQLPADGSYAHHLAHNWHVCAHNGECITAKVLRRYQHLSTLLFLREKQAQHGADHAAHVQDGEDGRYLWCEGCSRGPSRCTPTSGFFEQDLNVQVQSTRAAGRSLTRLNAVVRAELLAGARSS